MFAQLIKGSVLSVGLVMMLAGCGDDNNEVQLPVEYEVEISNLTNFQPLSPVGLIFDDEDFFEIGSPASLALEQLAEGGDNSALLDMGSATASSSDVILPGGTAVLTIRQGSPELKFSAFSMLVNTNDAFTGVSSYSLEDLNVGESVVINTNAYDAGTEANSESAGTIPGPADSGEGFNALRDDSDSVRMHMGVVSKDDGLTTSVLSAEAKFDNPVMRLRIRRIK